MKYLAVLIGVFLCSSASFATTLPPAPPTNLTSTALSGSQIKLSWTDNSNNETGFKIERSRDGATFVQKYAVGVNVTAYTDSGRQASTKYYYRVRAYDSGGNSGYSNTASATTAPSPAPSPTASPRPTPTQNIWISTRTDGLAGSGTQADPFNGSTPAKFDALMLNYYWTYNLGVHLVGPGPFRTDTRHRWLVRPGWTISGDGQSTTTVQLTGSLAGLRDVTVLKSDPGTNTDNVVLTNFTIDCNYPGLASTADIANNEANVRIAAVLLAGSNNLLTQLRSINNYGSLANKLECFTLFLAGPRNMDGTNNIIQYCIAERPYGYGTPFAIAGWVNTTPWRLITNSKIFACAAYGLNNGLTAGWTTGGVNISNVKDCVIDSNTFVDCLGAAYMDVGSVDGLLVTNNTVIRGWQGVVLSTSQLPKQGITISGNNINIQNRDPNGADLGIACNFGTTSNVMVSNNTITFDTSGHGAVTNPTFWGIAGGPYTTITIENNTETKTSLPLSNGVGLSAGVTLLNNRFSDGTPVPGL